MSDKKAVPKFKIKKEFNPLSGQPHTWKSKVPGKTPWMHDWMTQHNDQMPEQGLDPRNRDIPDDGFTLGDPLDDINHWELEWAAGRRPSEHDDVGSTDAAVEDGEHSESEDLNDTDVDPELSDGESEPEGVEIGESNEPANDNGLSPDGVIHKGGQKIESDHDSDEDSPSDIDDTPDSDNAPLSHPPPPPPPPPPKMISFELRIPHPPQNRALKPFRVQIFLIDTPEQILYTVENFFRGIHNIARVTGFEDEDGNAFVPQYENLVHDTAVYVRAIFAEADMAGEESKKPETPLLATRQLAKARRRKLNGGLTKIGRKRAWKKSGGLERKRINGRFAKTE